MSKLRSASRDRIAAQLLREKDDCGLASVSRYAVHYPRTRFAKRESEFNCQKNAIIRISAVTKVCPPKSDHNQ